MKNLRNIIIILFICLLIGAVSYGAFAHTAGIAADSSKTTAGVTKLKEQIKSMLLDSDKDFVFNQGATTLVLATEENDVNKTRYYESTTRYKGEVSLVRDQERNGVIYKTLIFGWKLEKNTPKATKEEAENARKASLKIIQEKVASGGYKSYKVKTTDSSMRTELRDSLGNRIFEIVENKNYFHLIIFGTKWRTDTVDGLVSDFTINALLERKEKRQSLK